MWQMQGICRSKSSARKSLQRLRECELQSIHSHKMPPARVVTIDNHPQPQHSGKGEDTVQKKIRLMRESTKVFLPPLLLKSSALAEQCHPEHEFGD
jgi:hypothetical protein